MPELDILIEIADFYDVNLREILDGEWKSERMDKELKETVLKVAEYSNEEKKRNKRMVLIYFVLGIGAPISNLVMEFFELSDNFLIGLQCY